MYNKNRYLIKSQISIFLFDRRKNFNKKRSHNKIMKTKNCYILIIKLNKNNKKCTQSDNSLFIRTNTSYFKYELI